MALYYLGAVSDWKNIQNGKARRRTDFMLKSLVESNQFKQVFIVKNTYPKKVLTQLFSFVCFFHNVREIFITQHKILRFLNPLFLFCQTLRFSKRHDIIWCYWPGAFKIFKQLKLKGRLVFDADHNIVEDINRERDQQESNKLLLKEIGKLATVIISGSRSMNNWFEKNTVANRDSILFVRNGISAELLDKPQRVAGFKKDLPKKPVITYIGVLSNWVDYSLLIYLASRNPAWTFNIIGQRFLSECNEGLTNLSRMPNIFFLGYKTPLEIKKALAETDVGLVLYKKAPWLDGDSMKIYEYLLMGVPVVSTCYHSFLEADFGGLIDVAYEREEFEIYIRKRILMHIEEKKNWETKSYNFLQKNTWEERLNSILSALKVEN